MENTNAPQWQTPEGKAALSYAHDNLALAKAFLAGIAYCSGQGIYKPVSEERLEDVNTPFPVVDVPQPPAEAKTFVITDPMGHTADLHDDEASFNIWWNLYNKKRGRRKAFLKWSSLPLYKRRDCIYATPAYVKSTPDVQYRKDPTTYLNGECYYDEIISQNEQQRFDPLSKAASILR